MKNHHKLILAVVLVALLSLITVARPGFVVKATGRQIVFNSLPLTLHGVVKTPSVTTTSGDYSTVWLTHFDWLNPAGTKVWWEDSYAYDTLKPGLAKNLYACVNGTKTTVASQPVVNLAINTVCNDFDSRLLTDTAAGQFWRLRVTAYYNDGTVSQQSRAFAVKNAGSSTAGAIWVNGAYAGGANDGTAAHPWTTVQAGVNALASGGLLIVKPSVYRESVTLGGTATGTGTLSKSGSTLIGQFGAVISANDVYAGTWTADGANWYTTGFTDQMYDAMALTGTLTGSTGGPGQCRDQTNKPCAENTQVFYDGVWLAPAKYSDPAVTGQTPPTALVSGKFWINRSTAPKRLYIAQNPAGHVVEMAARRSTFAGNGSSQSDSVNLRGFQFLGGFGGNDTTTIEPFNTGGQNRASQTKGVVLNGNNWRIDDANFSYARWSGVSLGGTGHAVRASKFHDNGAIGFTGTSQTTVIESNECYNNDNVDGSHLAGWLDGFEAGCNKYSGGSTTFLISHHLFAYNYVHDNGGVGLWIDYYGSDNVWYRNRSVNNASYGIDLEYNDASLVQENVVIDNGFEFSWVNKAAPSPACGATGAAADACQGPYWLLGAGVITQISSGSALKYNLIAWNGDGIAHYYSTGRSRPQPVGSATNCPVNDSSVGNTIVQHSHNVGDNQAYVIAWASDGSCAIQSQTGNTGTGDRFWTSSGVLNALGTGSLLWEYGSSFYNATSWSTIGGGSGATTMSDALMQSVLKAHGVPIIPRSRPTSGPY